MPTGDYPPKMPMHPQTCGTCGDVLNTTTCDGCASRDRKGMYSFRGKFVEADHKARELELQVDGLQKRLADALARPLPDDYAKMERLMSEINRIVTVWASGKSTGEGSMNSIYGALFADKRICAAASPSYETCTRPDGHEGSHESANNRWPRSNDA